MNWKPSSQGGIKQSKIGIFDFSKTEKEMRVNDFFNARERELLIEATFGVGNKGMDIKHHILHNGILNDACFELLKCLLEVELSKAMSSGSALNEDFVDLYHKIEHRGSSSSGKQDVEKEAPAVQIHPGRLTAGLMLILLVSVTGILLCLLLHNDAIMVWLVLILFTGLIAGMIKPRLFLRNKRCARLKIAGLWLLATMVAVITGSQMMRAKLSKMTSAELIGRYEKGNSSLVYDLLKKIPPEDSLYNKVQWLIAEAEKETTAKELLAQLQNATPVTDEENKLGLYIESVTKSDSGYLVDYGYSAIHVSRTDDQKIKLYVTRQIYFIDPENYENNYQPFTLEEDGTMRLTHDKGDEIGFPFPVRRIKFEPPSKVMYMYFTGIKDEGDDKMSKLATVPLFFTLVLGDNPQVFEKTPRHAKKLFDGAILKKQDD
jgi:hypothetical protein